jgi:hypothetical protein
MEELMWEIDNSQDVIDSRDVIRRIAELEELKQTLSDAIDDFRTVEESEEHTEEELEMALQARDAAARDFGDTEESELEALEALAEEAEAYNVDWSHGAALIRASYFIEYTKERCESIGAIPSNLPHYIVIDWTATADNFQVDYVEVDFDGEDYWIENV